MEAIIEKVKLSNKMKVEKKVAFPFFGFGCGDKIVSEIIIRKYKEKHPSNCVIGLEYVGDCLSMKDYPSPPDEIWIFSGDWDWDKAKEKVPLLIEQEGIDKVIVFNRRMLSWFTNSTVSRERYRIFEVLDAFKKRAEYPYLVIPIKVRHWAHYFFMKKGIPLGSLVIAIHIRNLHNYASEKNIDFNKYLTLMDILIKEYNATFIVIGKFDKNPKIEMRNVIDVSKDNLTLWHTAALIKMANLYIGTDSGPTHIAAAVGTPIVAVDYSDIHLGPYTDESKYVKLFRTKYREGSVPIEKICEAVRVMLRRTARI
ncbi:TPA: hypothetical protein EYP75_04345 [Candidatus Bathyarchaeota archaeon]|nr:hypothetical protein [Candidatus Bathyarchaeota archaeon]